MKFSGELEIELIVYTDLGCKWRFGVDLKLAADFRVRLGRVRPVAAT